MGIFIVKGDITERKVDAIGCSADSNLKLGGILGKKILEKGMSQVISIHLKTYLKNN